MRIWVLTHTTQDQTSTEFIAAALLMAYEDGVDIIASTINFNMGGFATDL
jgi:hypothetical protein